MIPDPPADYPIPLDLLPASSLCGFKIVPRVRTALLQLGESVSLGDLREYLDREEPIGPLAMIARTDYERRSLLDAYCEFIEAASESFRPGRAESPKLAWIVPQARLTPMAHFDGIASQAITDKELLAELGEEYRSWLPWMSLGIVNVFRRWRQPRIRTIRRAMFKLAGGAEAVFPWEGQYAPWRRYLPMHVLYRHEPSRHLEAVIASFTNLGLRSINDLRCCHPDAVSASKAKGRPLFLLYRLLEKDGASV